MKLELIRIKRKTETRCAEPVEVIDGQLYIEGPKICDTAENANGAMPAGDYPLSIIRCKQYSRKMILICQEGSKVPKAQSSSYETLEPETLELKCSKCKKLECINNNSTLPQYCPMLKPGNGVYKRLDGSIILGTYICPGCLKLPKQAFDSVYERLRKSAERGHEITLTIKNSFKQ